MRAVYVNPTFGIREFLFRLSGIVDFIVREYLRNSGKERHMQFVCVYASKRHVVNYAMHILFRSHYYRSFETECVCENALDS